MSSFKKRLDRLEEAVSAIAAKSNPDLCNRCGTACKTYNREWFERTGEEVYDNCMNRYVVLYGDWQKGAWK